MRHVVTLFKIQKRFILDVLGSCQRSLDVSIHLLTSSEIAGCMIESHKRGVRLRVICDNEMSTNKGSQVPALARAGIEVKIPLLSYHMHNKMAIVDGLKVITGSTNWTKQGIYGNWDNLLITSQPDIVGESVTTFDSIWNHPTVRMFT